MDKKQTRKAQVRPAPAKPQFKREFKTVRKSPQVGDNVMITVQPILDDQGQWTGRYQLGNILKRTVATVYTDGTIKDNIGEMWKVKPSSDGWVTVENQRNLR